MNARAISRSGAMRLDTRFNVFRLRGSTLACAVPIDRPVPRFVDARWDYLCEAGAGLLLSGFEIVSAARRCERRGFCLFRAVPEA